MRARDNQPKGSRLGPRGHVRTISWIIITIESELEDALDYPRQQCSIWICVTIHYISNSMCPHYSKFDMSLFFLTISTDFACLHILLVMVDHSFEIH